MRIGVRLAALLLTTSLAASAATPNRLVLTPGRALTHSAAVQTGVYALKDPGAGAVRISGHDITVDFRNASLHGDGTGSGIVVTDARNVTVENATVSGYGWGIVVQHSRGVCLLHCRASHNGDLPPRTVIDESGARPEDDHGGGIVLRDCTRCLLSADTATHEWDGADVIRSDHNVIQESDFSYNSNWGVHFWASSGNTFRHNRAVWCTTGAGMLYQALTGWQTYDAQAVAVEHNSNDNLIASNDLRDGGDGIFIRANEGPATPGGPPVPVLHGSHRNRLIGNDCSFSPNNAIEVDLVDDTTIVGNDCSHSHYGMWLGISQRCVVKRNLCVDDTAHAVEIERGRDDLFESNIFGSTIPQTRSLVYLRATGPEVPSGPYTIRDNLFFGAKTAVELAGTPATFSGNTVRYGGPAKLVEADAASPVTDAGGNTVLAMTPHPEDGPAWPPPSTPGVARKGSGPVIARVTPATPTPGSTVTLTGAGLDGASVLLEGHPADVVSADRTHIGVRLPQKLYFPAGFNIVVTPKGREPLPPIVITVDVPTAQRPHIIAATFSPTRLKVGDKLRVTFTLKNNTAFSADPTLPADGVIYDEGQSYHDRGWTEEHGKLYLRASTDSDGSWPYLWGIGATTLAPGETRTITGVITMKTPGTQTYRAGLVSGGIAFIDDSLFRTQVVVTP